MMQRPRTMLKTGCTAPSTVDATHVSGAARALVKGVMLVRAEHASLVDYVDFVKFVIFVAILGSLKLELSFRNLERLNS